MNTSKKVMVTRQYGSPIYIAPTDGGLPNVTDKLSESAVWGDMDGDSKLNYYRAVTTWDLEWEIIN